MFSCREDVSIFVCQYVVSLSVLKGRKYVSSLHLNDHVLKYDVERIKLDMRLFKHYQLLSIHVEKIINFN